MMRVKEVKEWLNGIDDEEFVFIDEGGLILVHTDDDYCEIGGSPLPDEAEPQCGTS